MVAAGLIVAPRGAGPVEVLTSTGGLPVHIAGAFVEPLAFEQAADGTYFVFDRRAHAVYRIDAEMTSARKIVDIGFEEGRLLEPSAFDIRPDGSFAVADGPNGRERVQVFRPDGAKVGGFTLPGRNAARVTIGSMVLNGVGSLAYTGRSILINQPETGSLITEYTLSGKAWRTIGRLRATGHEDERDLHLALNVGVPLTDPTGGYFFVFVTGIPMFRKYAQNGTLMFERHVEGPELDDVIRALPQAWPRRMVAPGGELPFVLPIVRAAAADPDGRLWIVLTQPYTYVYDRSGDKVRIVQFRAAGLISPTSLFFAGRRRLLVTPGCFEFPVQ